LVAENEGAYRKLEEFLIPEKSPAAARSLENVYRAGAGGEAQVDLVLYSQGLPCPRGAFQYRPEDPDSTLTQILREHDDLNLPLARQFPCFRKPVVEKIVHNVSLENAAFALATALPNIVPNLLELPWAIGEFASDTAFLTMNQMRMAFLIAAASGAEIGLGNQKAEMMTIVAGGFGWRAIARELAGKIPLGGGLIPKAAIAYAGTFVVGKGLERFHSTKQRYTKAESDQAYRAAFERGKTLAESFRKEPD
jgi:uncharacterized protein (DUF697 family)